MASTAAELARPQPQTPQASSAAGATSAASGPVAPVPALPKGGGAIRGIGEKFAANPVTGTASLQIPIATSATSTARGGFGPELSLSYDSGAGNGPFGHGFHLSIPQITRKTDKGLPRYDDARDSDVFLLSGAEDLVPTPGEEQDPLTGERVRRYRPRVEGAFARIERRTMTDGTVYWRATTAANVTSTYGRSAGARIADPRDARRVFSWLLEETRDDKGNVVAYTYKAEDFADVRPNLAWEVNRHRGFSPIVNRYLKSIRYGNTAPGDAGTCLFEVVFDYGEHDVDAPSPAEGATWRARQDPFSVYRAGFEIRTYRLCRRVLMFHHMSELGTTPCLVASTDFTYAENEALTQLVAAAQSGYVRHADGVTYAKKSRPPIELFYAKPELSTTVNVMDQRDVVDLPGGVTGHAQWVDLDGEGLPGVLSRQGGALHYKQNLGGGKLAPARVLAKQPALAQADAGAQIADLDGDGLKEMVVFTPPAAGFYTRTDDGDWLPFRAFASQPNVDFSDPNLRFIDLNGDGHDDLLITRGNTLIWYPSLAKQGFDRPITIQMPRDEEKGPALVFADSAMSVFLADMSGDGLTDLVRIKNGGVCYWPNLGFGRFGAKVTMGFMSGGAARFDHPDQFDPRRVRLADVDGTGTTDVLYLHRDGVRIYGNQSGNALGEPVMLPPFPDQSDLSSIGVVDLLGTGTGCLVWSSPLPRYGSATIRYVDLLGSKKPYLLTSYKNNLGLEVKLSYAPSTKFYRQDAERGEPWVTRLPFVVQTLERVESYDAVSRHRFVTRYAYHHGYYDGVEREFRGFGMVEQWDTESFAASAATSGDPEMHVPPVRSTTWFHTGACGAAAGMSAAHTVLPEGLSAEAQREACRALKGSMLRQEIHAEDGSLLAGTPYVVSEHRYGVRQIQAPSGAAHGVFLVLPREAIEYHHERNVNDPRVTHAFTLEIDDYGVARRSAAVAYPRKPGSGVLPEQLVGAITISEVDVVHVADQPSWYRIGVPVETRTYELKGLVPSASGLLAFDEVRAAAAAAIEIPYDGAPGVHPVEKRLLSQARTRYWKNDRSGPLGFGEVESLALPYQSFAKAFTPSLSSSRPPFRAPPVRMWAAESERSGCATTHSRSTSIA